MTGTDGSSARDIARLKRSVWLLGAAGLFFLLSAVIHLVQTGGVRVIDIVVPLWGALFVGYVRRLRAAQARSGQ